jgi:hypothetical protein
MQPVTACSLSIASCHVVHVSLVPSFDIKFQPNRRFAGEELVVGIAIAIVTFWFVGGVVPLNCELIF